MNWDEKPELNVTPLVDVMLVLVAILMLTTPMMLFEEPISVPKGSQKKELDLSLSIDISMDKRKNISIGKEKFEFDSFADSFLLYSNRYSSRDQKVLIRADKELIYNDVIYILKSVKAAKFTNISLVTD